MPSHKIVALFALIAQFASGQSLVAQDLHNDSEVTGTSREAFFKPAGSLSLGRFSHTTDVLALIDDENLREGLRSGGLSVDQQVDGSYQASMTARNLAIPQVDPDRFVASGLEPEFDTVQFTANLDVSEQQQGEDTLRGVDLKIFRLTLGGITVSGSGKMAMDDDDLMQGHARIKVSGWRKLLALLDLPNGSSGKQIEAGIAQFAKGDSVDLEVDITDNKVMLGPLVLATIPKI